MEPQLKIYLEEHNINYQEHTHQAVFTVEEAKAIKEELPATHAKCLFLKSNEEKFYLVALQADKRLDINALQNLLGIKKLRFASEEELQEHLHLKPGSVSIFGLIHDPEIIFLLDQELADAEKVGFHPNINTSTLVLDKDNLLKYYTSLPNEKLVVRLT